MSRLLLVRHGQASAGSGDYDRLSELGWRQARELGRYWAATGLAVDQVFVGPRRRQRETAEAVAEAFGSRGLPWPEMEPVEELDEHHGYRVFVESLPVMAESDAEAKAALELDQLESERDRKLYYRVYRRATMRWARGELEPPNPELERWSVFRRRVEDAVDRLVNGGGSGRTVVAFTSAGPVGVAVGRALALDHERTLALSWTVMNSAVNEFFFSGRRFSLHAFNTRPHLAGKGLDSWV